MPCASLVHRLGTLPPPRPAGEEEECRVTVCLQPDPTAAWTRSFAFSRGGGSFFFLEKPRSSFWVFFVREKRDERGWPVFFSRGGGRFS